MHGGVPLWFVVLLHAAHWLPYWLPALLAAVAGWFLLRRRKRRRTDPARR